MNKHLNDPVVEGYLHYLADVQRRAVGTVRDVRCSLKRVCGMLRRRYPEQEPWKLPLEAFLWWIEQERTAGTTPQTLAKYVTHMRCLLDYAWRSDRAERNVLDGFQLQDPVVRRPEEPPCLTEEEAYHLVRSLRCDTKRARRNRLIVLLFYGCGLRTSELCQLRLADVDLERQELFIRHGKGDRQRRVPVPAAVYTDLLAYIAERGRAAGPLFRTIHKKRVVGAQEACDIVRLAARQAGLSRDITPKVLRHSYATHLMDRGVDLSVIASLMGHRSPQESGVYLHVLGERAPDAVRRLERRIAGNDAEAPGGER